MTPVARTRLTAAVGVALLLLAAAVGVQMLGDREARVDEDLPRLHLIEPSGLFESPPGVFRWEPFTGASLYRLTLSDQDTIWPLIRREVRSTSISLEPGERDAFAAPRKYEWEIEALTADGETTLARGIAYFAVTPPGGESVDAPTR